MKKPSSIQSWRDFFALWACGTVAATLLVGGTVAATLLVGGIFAFLALVNGLSANPEPVVVTGGGILRFACWMLGLGFFPSAALEECR